MGFSFIYYATENILFTHSMRLITAGNAVGLPIKWRDICHVPKEDAPEGREGKQWQESEWLQCFIIISRSDETGSSDLGLREGMSVYWAPPFARVGYIPPRRGCIKWYTWSWPKGLLFKDAWHSMCGALWPRSLKASDHLAVHCACLCCLLFLRQHHFS